MMSNCGRALVFSLSFFTTIFSLSFLLLAGCGASVGKPVGKVTSDGKPVKGADLRFQPAGDTGVVVSGASNADGSYYVDNQGKSELATGKWTVTVTTYSLKNGKPLPDGEDGVTLKADPERSLRKEYKFEIDVQAGNNAFDFDLTKDKLVTGK